MARALTPEDHRRIAEAIRDAEARTAGEIYCVLARSSDAYLYPAAFVLSLIVLVMGVVAAFLLRHLWVDPGLPLFAIGLLAAWLAGLGLLNLAPSLRLRLVPRTLAWQRAHENAARQFLARNIHVTTARTGVLLFVSLAERYAEVIADEGIDARVTPETWDNTVAILLDHARRDRLADGYVAAVAAVGAVLGEHVPPRQHDHNELDDRLVEI